MLIYKINLLNEFNGFIYHNGLYLEGEKPIEHLINDLQDLQNIKIK